MDRFWFLTSTTYGSWLPGDHRGSVTRTREDAGPRIERDRPQTPYVESSPALQRTAAAQLKGPPVFLNAEQAEEVADQFLETAEHRGWSILAVAIMRNHFHLLVGVPGDPEPSNLLRDFKSWASRRLNRRWNKPPGETWWTEKGSMRKKSTRPALRSAAEYIRHQDNPLIVEINDPLNEQALALSSLNA